MHQRIPTRSRHALATAALTTAALATAALTSALIASIALAAPPASRLLDARAIDLPRLDTSVLTARCAHTFVDRGRYQIPAGYSGAGTSAKAIPADKVLQVRSVTITLDEADWRGAHLRIQGGGELAWYPLRTQNAAAVFRVREDGPLYADGGGKTVSFVSYRSRGFDRPVNGTYAIQGCLLDSIPQWVTIPDVRVPRYPKRVLTPLEPVELWDGVRQPAEKPHR
ncbi:hypothetical protein ACYX7E_00030 [Luteimonas sp. RIT-PG2_3]